MSSQVFYRKWRPQTLAEVVGQEHVTQTLRNALTQGKVAHAYLFCGPRGTGKTSTGRILAKAVNCLTNGKGEPCNTCSLCQSITEGRAMDIVEIDAASNRGIDDVRKLRERVGFAPGIAHYKVYIIDEVHMLTTEASNALLKTLEEPPPYAIFVLATTEAYKVLPTIQSRCQRFDFHRLSSGAVVSRLEHICSEEGIKIDPQALKLVARSATGSLRDAQNLLEQLVAYYGQQIEVQQVQAMLGITGDWRARELAKQIINKDISGGLGTINSVLVDGLDLRQFHVELMQYLRDLLLLRAGSEQAVDLAPQELEEMKSLASQATLEEIANAVRAFSKIDLRLDSYSSLPLEMALVECALPPAAKEERKQAASPKKAEIVKSPSRVGVAPKAEPAVAKIKAEARAEAPKPEVVEAPTPEPAPPPEPVSPVPQGIASPPATPDIQYFRTHWKEFIDSLRGEGSTGTLDAMLRNACEPVALEGDTLVLGFYYSFHKDKIEDPKYLHLIKRKLSQIFGNPYEIRCVLRPKEKKATSTPPPQGHLVKAALDMGAKIIKAEEK